MRAVRSPAISDRASVPNVRLKLSLNPRTPTRAATPIATDSTTKPNLPGADLRSRHPMVPARFQLSERFSFVVLASIILGLACRCDFGHAGQCVFYHLPISENNLAVCHIRHFGVMRDQHKRRACALIAFEQQVKDQATVR